MAADLIRWAAKRGWPVSLYTNRRLLTEQLSRMMDEENVEHGVRASGFDDVHQPHLGVQISSTQTELSRVYQQEQWELHPAKLVLVDEAHLQKAGVMSQILRDHMEKHDSAIVGLTATPLGVNHIYSRLIVAGSVSEGRNCGALLPCDVHGCKEIDTRKIKRQANGEFAEADLGFAKRTKKWKQVIFADVLESWRRLNPEGRPTVLFAPGVDESVWFAQQFEAEGIRAAHIDGSDLYVDGERMEGTRGRREEMLAEVARGDIQVVCNRFVLREGIDLPELFHCILATPIGSLLSYVQTVGRVLRNHDSLDSVMLQDHGGNWWRHGSPNADRDWTTWFDFPPRVATDARLDRIASGSEAEPITCPNPECGAVRTRGIKCPKCGHVCEKRTREVLMEDGSLVTLAGSAVPSKRRVKKQNTETRWENCYWRAKRSKKRPMTFKQAEGLFVHENGYWPPRDLKMMPINGIDWYRLVRDVPEERLL